MKGIDGILTFTPGLKSHRLVGTVWRTDGRGLFTLPLPQAHTRYKCGARVNKFILSVFFYCFFFF